MSHQNGNKLDHNLRPSKLGKITIGIHPHPKDPERFHEKWADFLSKQGVNVRWVNLLSENALEQATKCDGIMWRWLHNWQDKQSAKQILQIIEHYLDIPVFPDQRTSWHYDEKVSQFYLLKSIDAPVPYAWVFWDRQEAISWAQTARYPLVFKLSVGAGSANILIVNTASEAVSLINKAFNGGMFPYTMNEFRSETAGPRPPHWKPEFDYVYFQEFLPGNDFDTRITIIGDRAFGFRRFNRPGDFRASGSGLIDYTTDKIDRRCVEIAFSVSERCGFTSMAYDFLNKDGYPLICEISYTFNDEAVFNCPGHWQRDLQWHEGHIWPEKAQVDDFLERIKNRISIPGTKPAVIGATGERQINVEQTLQKAINILIFYDEPGWAWWHRSHNIKSCISDKYQITIKKIGDDINFEQYDLILLFESYLYEEMLFAPRNKIIVGSSTLKTLPRALNDYMSNRFAAFVVNNKEAYDRLSGIQYTYCCQNGVDESLFYYKYPRCDELTACWVGNNSSINNKGLDLIQEACSIAGVDLLLLDQSVNVYKGNLLSQTEVRDTIYHHSTCYICASEMEGTPNPALEALACGLPVISTRVGNMPELIVDGYNGFLADRTVEDIVDAINKLKSANLEEMSNNARKSILNGWRWKDQVIKYEKMFDEVANNIRQNSTGNEQQLAIPFVSVILPTFNRPDMLGTAISSILSQTMQSFEIIVVNDAGADVAPVLEMFSDKGKILHIRHETNRGLAAARNTGIRAARGKYIAYLDDDDIYYPNHLETLVNFLESNDCRVAYTDAVRAVQQNTGDGYQTVEKNVLYSRDFDYDAILVDNFIPVLCVIHEKECLSLSGMFDESLPRHEDWDLWIRMSRHDRFAHLPTVTCEYTYRPDGSGMTSSTLPLFLKTYKAVYRKYENLVAEKPCVQASRQKSLFNATFRTFQHIGERVEPYLNNSNVTGEMLAQITPSGAGFSQIKSCLTWRKADSMPAEVAIPYLEMALAIDSENHPARIALCERYLKTGSHVDALKHMEFLADANPNEPEFTKTRDALKRKIEADSPQTGFLEPTSYSVQTCDTPTRPVTVSVFSLDAPQEACARIRLLAHIDGLNGSIKPNWGVISDGVNCTTNLDMIDQADIIVIQRFYPRKGTVPYIEKMLSSGKPVIYEVDDLLFDLPADNHLKFWAGETVDLFPWLLPRVTAITVSTPFLAKEFSVFNPSVHVIPNLADTELFQPVASRKNGPDVIGFSGTVTHAHDLERIGEALFRVADRYGDKVAFSFMGLSSSEFSSLQGFRFLDFERDYASYGKALSSSGIDIALVPLQDSRFNRCKSNIKWLEYSACGIAGIYADLPPYNTSIEHGVTGVLVDDDPDKWFQAICLLIDHPELRQRIANQARTEVLSHHSLKGGSQVLYTLYESMVSGNICTKIAQ
jgi:glycosyltransferase involved in cell wall biosynthesis/glutathione synthase/RimK-type ligase-like ATP-grasp enzyme